MLLRGLYYSSLIEITNEVGKVFPFRLFCQTESSCKRDSMVSAASGGVYDINKTQEGATSITLNFTNPTSATKGTLFLSRVRELPLQESNGDAGGKIDVSYVQNKDVTFE